MLLGCCHCGEEDPPSESDPPSDPPSESQSESDPSESESEISVTNVPCFDLCGGVMPRRYKLNVPNLGVWTCCLNEPNPGCGNVYGDFILRDDGGGTPTPVWGEVSFGVSGSYTGCNRQYWTVERNFEGTAPRYRLLLAELLDGRIDVRLYGLWRAQSGTRHGSVQWDDLIGTPGKRYVCLGGFELDGGRGSGNVLQNCWGGYGFLVHPFEYKNSPTVTLSPA
jgi:hypothetical protein